MHADRQAAIASVTGWFAVNTRDLPWRHSTPWGVLVSEFMLQQTPVSRVLDVWAYWLGRWPNPAALAAEPSSAAVAAWGRLGYPRRALRLHAAATAIVGEHGGEVPRDHDALLGLPGVGAYTAAAVASFAFGDAYPVLDTNVRRVLARLESGTQFPPPHPSAAERVRATEWTTQAGPRAALWAAAVMELGALVCTSRRPDCGACPVAESCAWHAAGHPPGRTRPRAQAWAGTNRQCRGVLLDVVRRSPDGVDVTHLLAAWDDRDQAVTALDGLVADGLVALDGHLVRL
ncbi:A/G-specific adenine glycosylase [Brooklawnia cerclae]|uniref:Adenine DNA glycosylase n=1 Tax=Brooklawnia cerclae TaxID=349934 RepID=A0ABX0SB28_9ACTN|nr:A/G-specific adenine glycosylase [Brooklawnia cerclae]NIH55588.1 A/G-specific adenine glycosylase [Brooklawnia cerclae]